MIKSDGYAILKSTPSNYICRDVLTYHRIRDGKNELKFTLRIQRKKGKSITSERRYASEVKDKNF